MNDDITSLFAYNRWADRKILDVCRTLSFEQYVAEPAPGWTSVRSTLNHIAIATEGWLRVLNNEAVSTFPSDDELPTLDDAERLLETAYANFEENFPKLTPEELASVREYRGDGQGVKLPPWAAFRHIVNHATYHRGQIASKLGRLGVQPPSTDFIYWVLEQVPQG